MDKDNQHSKQLKDIEKKQVFQAPEGYFEQLPDKILARIAAEEQPKPMSAKIIPFNKWWIAVAASVVLIVSVFIMFFVNDPHATNYYAVLDDVSSEEIADYLEETDITIAELEKALASEGEINLYDDNVIPELEEGEDAEALLEYYSL